MTDEQRSCINCDHWKTCAAKYSAKRFLDDDNLRLCVFNTQPKINLLEGLFSLIADNCWYYKKAAEDES